MPAWLLAVVTVNFLLQVAVSAARPLTSVRALGLGADSLELALLAAGYAVFALVASVPIGRMIDRWGSRLFIVLGSFVLAVMLLLTATANSTIILIAIQSGIGLALINANLGMQSTIGARSSPESSASAFGHYSTGAGIGLLVGPVLAGVLMKITNGTEAGEASAVPDPSTTTVPFLVLACVALIALALAQTLPSALARSPKLSKSAQKPAGWLGFNAAIFQQPGVAPVLVASAIFVTNLDLLAIYMPAYGLERGYSVPYIGFLLGIAAAGSIVARLLTGAATRAFGRTRILMASLLTPALGFILLPLIPSPFVPLVLAIIGLGLGFGQPTTMSWIASLADAGQLAATLGVRVSGNRIGQLVIPVIVGSVIAVSSLTAGFWTMAALLAGTALLFAPRLKGNS
jgi:MFS family permease